MRKYEKKKWKRKYCSIKVNAVGRCKKYELKNIGDKIYFK